MTNKTIGILAGIGIVILAGILFLGSVSGLSNREFALRTTIEAKQTDNKNEMDNMWKTISQVAQVTEAQKDALIEVFKGYAQARTGTNHGGSLANWIHEAVPNVDTSTFNNLQNIITGKRDNWTMRQKELLDLQREQNALFRPFPSLDGIILNILGRKPIKVTIVTSTRTEKAFETGKDDNVELFKR